MRRSQRQQMAWTVDVADERDADRRDEHVIGIDDVPGWTRDRSRRVADLQPTTGTC
jgi:hypothetical protein